MEVHWSRSLDIGHQKLMEIKSMPIKKKEIGEHDCHLVNWKGVNFYVFVLKDPNYNMITMSKYSVIMLYDYQKEEYRFV